MERQKKKVVYQIKLGDEWEDVYVKDDWFVIMMLLKQSEWIFDIFGCLFIQFSPYSLLFNYPFYILLSIDSTQVNCINFYMHMSQANIWLHFTL